MIINKPATGNFPAYASLYIDLIADDGHVITRLTDQLPSTLALLQSLPDSTLRHRYAQDKWSIKEILSHIIDDERIYVYRALRFARNDCTELPGFDQDQYVADSAADSRTGQEIIEEYAATRRASIAFFQGLNERQWQRSGIADGHRATVGSLVCHIAGHEVHHMNTIKARYVTNV